MSFSYNLKVPPPPPPQKKIPLIKLSGEKNLIELDSFFSPMLTVLILDFQQYLIFCASVNNKYGLNFIFHGACIHTSTETSTTCVCGPEP